MQLRNTFLMLILTLSVISCATTRQTESNASASDSEKFVMRGFSLSVPASEGWNVVKKSPLRIVLTKQGVKKDERYAIQALIVELPNFKSDKEFLQYIESRMNNNRGKSTSKVIEVKTSLIAGQEDMCVQSHSKEEVYAGLMKTSNAARDILEVVNFTCRYPDMKGAGIYFAYSKQSFSGSADEDLTTEASKVFSNLNFTDI